MRVQRFLKCCLEIALFLLIMVILSTQAQAHKVMIFAYEEGETVYAEGYFADGKKAQDSLVEVYGEDSTKLLEGKTDTNGLFSFPIPDTPEIRIVLTASMGHRAECTLKGNGTVKTDTVKKEGAGVVPPQGEKVHLALDEDRIRAIVSEELDKKIAPLAREVALLQQEKTSFTDIIGGIGYIIGIMGLLMYFKARRKE